MLARLKDLDVAITALPNDDQRKIAWVSVDRNSSIWVASCPSGRNRAGPAAFQEIACRYMGKPSPTASALAGQSIWSMEGVARGVCDPYGIALTSCVLSGDGWRRAHDTIKHAISDTCSTYQVEFTCEVFGLFASCIPQGQHRDALVGAHARGRLGMIPDFRFDGMNELLSDGAPVAGTQMLGELKRINQGPTRYPTPLVGNSGIYARRQAAVNTRANLLQAEREREARVIDAKFGQTPAGQHGAVHQRLRSYGKILGLVVGHFGEWSKDLNRLVGAIAELGVPRVGHLYTSRGHQAAKAALLLKARRDIAWAGINANAKLLLDRSEWVGESAMSVDRSQEAKKQRVRFQHEAARDALNAQYAVHQQGQGYSARSRGG